MQGEMLGITGYQTAHPYVTANVVLMHARGQLVLETYCSLTREGVGYMHGTLRD